MIWLCLFGFGYLGFPTSDFGFGGVVLVSSWCVAGLLVLGGFWLWLILFRWCGFGVVVVCFCLVVVVHLLILVCGLAVGVCYMLVIVGVGC